MKEEIEGWAVICHIKKTICSNGFSLQVFENKDKIKAKRLAKWQNDKVVPIIIKVLKNPSKNN